MSQTTPDFNLTDKEFQAAFYLVKACFENMGGERPSDLELDEYTWVALHDLMVQGYSQQTAAGLFSSLHAKGFIAEYEPNQMIVTSPAWRWMDTKWDAHIAKLEGVKS